MNNIEIFENLKRFISKQRWDYDFPLTEETTLEKDLSIYGDDAVEFIVAFGKEFNVDVSKFMAADYFSSEGDSILPAIIRFLTGKKKQKQKDLKLKHLEKAVIAGKLDEQVISD